MNEVVGMVYSVLLLTDEGVSYLLQLHTCLAKWMVATRDGDSWESL